MSRPPLFKKKNSNPPEKVKVVATTTLGLTFHPYSPIENASALQTMGRAKFRQQYELCGFDDDL